MQAALHGFAAVLLSTAALASDAIFEIDSVTKQFTAVAVLRLREQGRLDLYADLTDYLPDYDTQGRSVSVRRLLDHTSGIQGDTEMQAFWDEISPRRLPRERLVERFEAEPFQFEPGTALVHDNSAYFLLGLIIEAVSGTNHAEFLETEVFPRAGLERTAYCSKEASIAVELNDDGRLVAGGPWPDEPLDHVEGTTFASGVNRYAFTLDRGAPARLRVDRLMGAYVPDAGAPREGESTP